MHSCGGDIEQLARTKEETWIQLATAVRRRHLARLERRADPQSVELGEHARRLVGSQAEADASRAQIPDEVSDAVAELDAASQPFSLLGPGVHRIKRA